MIAENVADFRLRDLRVQFKTQAVPIPSQTAT
jgi:hypothetical protein